MRMFYQQFGPSISRWFPSAQRLTSAGHALLLVAGSLYLLTYLAIAAARLSYPYELEWMEGGSVVQVQRVLEGQPLYVAPSIDFVPFIYTPLYFYVSSLMASVTGNGFFPLRLVSFLASLGCFALIFLIVRRRTCSNYASFMAACLFAASFRIAGAWFDLARVDSLFMLLLLASLYAFESPRPLVRNGVSPALLFLAFFTKQSALLAGAMLCMAAFVTRKRWERLWFAATFTALVAGSAFVLNGITDGWYRYYVFELPSQHHILKSMVIQFWTSDIAHQLPIALCICLIPIFTRETTLDTKPDKQAQDSLILVGLFLCSFSSRIHSGGYDNVLMPVYAGIAIYFGIGLATVRRLLRDTNGRECLLLLAVLLQFAGLFYWPRQQIPSLNDRRQGATLDRLISSFNGEVYLPDHPWYLQRQNKPTQAQGMATFDIMRASGSDHLKDLLNKELTTAIAAQRYAALMMESREIESQAPGFTNGYYLAHSNLTGEAFHPVTGGDHKPNYLYLRRTPRPQ